MTGLLMLGAFIALQLTLWSLRAVFGSVGSSAERSTGKCPPASDSVAAEVVGGSLAANLDERLRKGNGHYARDLVAKHRQAMVTCSSEHTTCTLPSPSVIMQAGSAASVWEQRSELGAMNDSATQVSRDEKEIRANAIVAAEGYLRRRGAIAPEPLRSAAPADERRLLFSRADARAEILALERACAECELQISRLTRLRIDDYSAEQVLSNAPEDQRTVAAGIVGVAKGTGAGEIVKALRKAGSNDLATILRGGEGVPYDEVVRDAAKALDVQGEGPVVQVEQRVLLRFFSEAWSRMPQTERDRSLHTILTAARAAGWSEGGLATIRSDLARLSAAALAGSMMGFAPFVAASVTLHALAATVGLTLPFVVYSSVSSVLGLLFEPITAAAFLGLALLGPAKRKTVPSVALMAALRENLRMARDGDVRLLEATCEVHRARIKELVATQSWWFRSRRDDRIPFFCVVLLAGCALMGFALTMLLALAHG